MFAARIVARNFNKFTQRSFANAPIKAAETGKQFKSKTMFEAWCTDAGAYPVMGVIVIAVIFSLGSGAYFMATHPDSRISKKDRLSVFRGDLAGEN